jgi:hypothetical protein
VCRTFRLFDDQHKKPTINLFKGIIMKSIKTLRFTKSIIAIAIAASGISTSGIALTPNQSGTPDDGMVCRTGYVGFLDGSAFKCKKNTGFKMELSCDGPTFTTYVNRAAGASVPNGPNDAALRNGLDICTRTPGTPGAVNIGPTDTLNGLVQSTNGNSGVYEIAKVNPAQITVRVANWDEQEASAIGLNANQVDTVQSINFNSLNTGVGKIKDQHVVEIIHYTFAIPTGGIISGPVVTPASAFVPRPLQ